MSFKFLSYNSFSRVKIMPTANKAAKAVFDNGKTSSYHINSLFSCQNGKTPSSAFRIVVHRGSGDGAHKRYEFEAENPKLASACRFSYGGVAFLLTLARDRRDRADDQSSQVCIGAYRQHDQQNTTEQASTVILRST